MVRALALVVLMFSLSGCLLATGPGLFAVGTATFINTDKTMTDHALSFVTGQDCSTLEYSKGEGYCQPHESEQAIQPDLVAQGGTFVGYGPYCYRTIGRVTCYSHPDPSASEYARLN